MALFEVKPQDKRIYEEELKDFLPEKMLDIHTHVWLEEFFPPAPPVPGEEKRCVTWPTLVARDNSFADLQETYRLMFPGKHVEALMFSNSGRSQEANDYVADASRRSGFPALYFSAPEETPDEVERQIRRGNFLGVKSYLTLAPAYLPEAEIRIFDFFPKPLLKRMDQIGAIVMLHIPRNGRLKDPVNLAQILEIKEEFPNLRLVIAHIGRAYVKSDIGSAFEMLSKCDDLLFDFSANCCEYAMTKLLEAVGPKRVMFGSDLPILRMRTHRIEENNTYINLVPPGIYGDPTQDPHLREVGPEEAEKITFFMYEELLAFKRAAVKAGLTKEDIRDVFYQNAKRLIDGARKDIYGKGE